MNKEYLRMQKLAGVITEGQYKEKLEENFLKNLARKLKRFFTGEKMRPDPNNDPNKEFCYYIDDDGKKWFVVYRADLRYEPGYRKSLVSIYDLKDEEKIKKASQNFQAQNKEYMSTVEDPFGGGSGDSGFTAYKGDYFQTPVKVVNSVEF